MKKFAVVHFLQSNSVDFVPSKWILEDKTKCAYPKQEPPEFQNLKRNPDSLPEKNWGRYRVRFIKSYGKSLVFVNIVCDRLKYHLAIEVAVSTIIYMYLMHCP